MTIPIRQNYGGVFVGRVIRRRRKREGGEEGYRIRWWGLGGEAGREVREGGRPCERGHMCWKRR